MNSSNSSWCRESFQEQLRRKGISQENCKVGSTKGGEGKVWTCLSCKRSQDWIIVCNLLGCRVWNCAAKIRQCVLYIYYIYILYIYIYIYYIYMSKCESLWIHRSNHIAIHSTHRLLWRFTRIYADESCPGVDSRNLQQRGIWNHEDWDAEGVKEGFRNKQSSWALVSLEAYCGWICNEEMLWMLLQIEFGSSTDLIWTETCIRKSHGSFLESFLYSILDVLTGFACQDLSSRWLCQHRPGL